ncbi:MAG: TIGR01212 family radical SAM protein [Fibromonadales bacterium]|nr:TIGR01212 family radical SAM protein [Fibromonadales bacterium]
MRIKLYKDFLKEVFPECERVRKVSLNAGFSCPNLDGTVGRGGCDYCDNKSFSAVAMSELSVMEQLEDGIKKNKNCGIIAYFQNYTNTHAPVEKLREVFMPVTQHSKVLGISVGTRPDCLKPEVVSLLAYFNKIKKVIVEIGVQSANDKTLKSINRNHTAECVRSAAARCKDAGLLITSHIIIGLPNEDMEDFINTARLIAECGFSAVKIHPLHIARGTKFAEEYARGKFGLLGMEDYCKAAAEVIAIVQPSVAIERVSAECPSYMLVAPDWCGLREKIWEGINAILEAEVEGR